jgi:hypothetical protein
MIKGKRILAAAFAALAVGGAVACFSVSNGAGAGEGNTVLARTYLWNGSNGGAYSSPSIIQGPAHHACDPRASCNCSDTIKRPMGSIPTDV